MDGSSGELEIKYQKIASEYAKLRAQASVLKKAVVEEQSRNIELQDVLREKEQHFRKSTHEIDSLTFRNQQLTKRVTVLQSELDATEYRSKRGKNKIPNNNLDVDSRLTMNVLDEELQKKILENAELVSKIHDEDEVHKKEVTVLKTYVEKLEHELDLCRRANNAAEKNIEVNFDKFHSEKSSSSMRANRYSSNRHTQENPGISQLNQGVAIGKELSSKQQLLGSMSEKDIILTNQRFEGNLSLSELDVLPDQHLHHLHSFPLNSQAGNCVRDLTNAISDYHTLTEQRLHCVQTPLSELNCKFSRHLKESSIYLQGIDRGFSELQANSKKCDQLFIPRLHILSDKLSAYTSYLLKLLPYQQLSLDEESATMPNEEKLITANKEVALQVSHITDCFIKLSSSVKLLSHQSDYVGDIAASLQSRFFKEIVDSLTNLAEVIEDLSQAYITKHDQEKKLPTFSEKLKTTNNSIVNALSSMTTASEKLSKTLSESHLLTLEPRRKSVELQSASSCSLASSGANLYREVQNSPSYKTLEEQLQACKKKAISMEQEKEHWHLEYQLLQLKHSKEMEELEKQLAYLPHLSAASKENAVQPPEPCIVTNLLGSLNAPLVLNAEMELREQQVKNCLTKRINYLVAMCQGADGKAITYRAECAVLEKRLELSTSSRVNCEGRLQEAVKKVIHLQEELNTTTHNYETQLSIMSEHLANMNDKLTVQRDEIDQLKYQLSNKSSQKRKQK